MMIIMNCKANTKVFNLIFYNLYMLVVAIVLRCIFCVNEYCMLVKFRNCESREVSVPDAWIQ